MNMKKMMLAVAATLAGTVMADVSVENVKCVQRYPWNGLVDIEYTIACDDPEADVYVNPVAYDGDRRLTLFPSAFTGDGATNTVKAGRHKMVWDAKKDFGTFSSANFQIKMYAGKRLSRYVVVDLSSGPNSTDYPIRLSHVGPDLSDDTCRTTELWLRLVPPGEFWMGSPADELGRENDEDLHHVTFTKPFYIGVFEVTMKQWELVMNWWDYNPLFRNSANHDIRPVTNQRFFYMRGNFNPNAASGFSSDSFISKLRSRTKAGAFDLPTESRWEYACRAGTTTALYNGRNLTETTVSAALAEIAAYYGNRYNDAYYNDNSVAVGTTPVGSFRPNALGLYDMLGNVWETCRDGLASEQISGSGTEDVTDPVALGGTEQYRFHVVRGGCWMGATRENRAAERAYGDKNNSNNLQGFRVCAEAEF